jgi:tripartite-type tricarboxylate transporter receptor subunit TctC
MIRLAIRRLATALCFGAGFGAVWAQGYPSKPLRVIIPHAAGSSPDVVTRLVTQKLSERIGQPVVVDNRVGAGGSIGLGAGAKAAPDGYTLVIGHVGTLTINPNIYADLPYDPKRDFAPVTLSVTTPLLVVVAPDSPYKSVVELIAGAKANPGRVTFSSAGNGTASHMAGVLFGAMAGASLVHVPYKTAPAALTAVAGGDVNLTFGGQPPAWPLVKGGKLRALGLTSSARVGEFPDTPVLGEAVSGYEVLDWNGFMVPAGTAPEIIARLNRELLAIINDADMTRQLRAQGLAPATGTPDQFAAWIERERQKWARVAKDIKLKLD